MKEWRMRKRTVFDPRGLAPRVNEIRGLENAGRAGPTPAGLPAGEGDSGGADAECGRVNGISSDKPPGGG